MKVFGRKCSWKRLPEIGSASVARARICIGLYRCASFRCERFNAQMSCLFASLLSASLAVPGKQVQWFTSLPHSSLLHHSCPIPAWFRPTRGCSYHRDSLLKFPTEGGRTVSILIILVEFHALGIPVTCSANSFFFGEKHKEKALHDDLRVTNLPL